MEYKKRKNLVFLAGILLLVSAIITLISIINLITSPESVLSTYISLFESMQPETDYFIDFNILFNTLFILSLVADAISLIFSVVCGVFYIVRSKKQENEFYQKKKSFIVVTILNLLFVGNIFAFIMSLVAIMAKQPQKNICNFETDKASFDEIVYQVKKIKRLKENGNITEEEYSALLSDLIK